MTHGIPVLGRELVDPAGESAEEQASSHCLTAQTDVQWYLSPRQVNTLERAKHNQSGGQGCSPLSNSIRPKQLPVPVKT